METRLYATAYRWVGNGWQPIDEPEPVPRGMAAGAYIRDTYGDDQHIAVMSETYATINLCGGIFVVIAPAEC